MNRGSRGGLTTSAWCLGASLGAPSARGHAWCLQPGRDPSTAPSLIHFVHSWAARAQEETGCSSHSFSASISYPLGSARSPTRQNTFTSGSASLFSNGSAFKGVHYYMTGEAVRNHHDVLGSTVQNERGRLVPTASARWAELGAGQSHV